MIKTKKINDYLSHINFIATIVVVISSITILCYLLKITPSSFYTHLVFRFNTGLAFLASGVVLHLLTKESTKLQSILLGSLSGFIMALGLLTLIQYHFKIDFHIDQLFVKDIHQDNIYPGRMSWVNSYNFVIIGIAVISKRVRLVSTLAALAVMIISFLILILYFYGSLSFLAETINIRMTITSALLFILIAIAVMMAEPTSSIIRSFQSDLPGSKLGRRLLPLSIIAVVLLGLLRIVGVEFGWFSITTGVTLVTICNIVIIITIVFINVVLINKEAVRYRNKQSTDLARLNDIIATQSKLANMMLDEQGYMKLMVEKVKIFTRAMGAAIVMVEDEKITYYVVSKKMKLFKNITFDLHSSLTGLCVKRREILLCNDIESDTRIDHHVAKQTGLRSIMVAPLIHHDKAIGAMQAVAKKPNHFKQDDVSIMKVMAGLLSSALSQQAEFARSEELLKAKIETLATLKTEIALRKNVAEQLRFNMARAQMIIDNSSDAFIGMDEDNEIIEWNHEASILFGYSKAEVMGKPISEIILPSRLRKEHENLTANLNLNENKMDTRIEFIAATKNNREFHVEATISRITTREVTQYFMLLRDISERKKQESELIYLAKNDPLTTLPNRTLFQEFLLQAIRRDARQENFLALLYIDIDYFKAVNDDHGHLTGDRFLQMFAARLKKNIRDSDVAARLSGDEFAVIIENISRASAKRIAKNILENMQEPFRINEEVTLNITVSIGIAFFNGEDMDVEEFIKKADTALYAAKGHGRNRFEIAN